MPKINVYLPDDLAETVKELNIPVSAICQRALEGSVKRIALIRMVTVDDLQGEKAEQLTQRALVAIRLAAQRAADTKITTAHLLHGIVSEGANLALDVLRALDIEPRTLSARLASIDSSPGT